MRQAFNAYAETDRITGVAAAQPVELVIMVYERIFDHLSSAEHCMTQGEAADAPLIKAVDLINEGLLACLNDEQGGEISKNLRTIYQWAMGRLMSARLQPNAQTLIEVRGVLGQLADGWRDVAQRGSNARLSIRQEQQGDVFSPNLRASFST